MRIPIMLIIAALLGACGSASRPGPVPDAGLIPAGRGHWVRVERDIRLDSLTGPRLVLPYGRGGAMPGTPTPGVSASAAAVVEYRVAFRPEPLDRDDRCALEAVALQLVHGDGSIAEIPARGHVEDNSDGLPGFRVELSKRDRTTLVIPAGASATVVFSAPLRIADAKPIADGAR